MEIKIQDTAYKIFPGEMVLFKDGKKIGICFEEGKLEVLNFEKAVDKGTVERFIDLFVDFYESQNRKAVGENLTWISKENYPKHSYE